LSDSAEKLGLTRVSDSDLIALMIDVDSGNLSFPLTEGKFVLRHYGHLWQHCNYMAALNAAAVTVLIKSVLAERNGHRGAKLSLVWTGPEATVSKSRDTAVVVKELFRRAFSHVIVCGYSFDHGSDILQPLHEAMRDRGVKVELFLDLGGQAETKAGVEHHAIAFADRFFLENWTFGPPRPTIYYNPKSATPGYWGSMHAKCIVVDDQFSLITSANFTNRGQNRNIEAGVLIEDNGFAAEFGLHWMRLVELGVFKTVS
jgi:hypothetical protein